MKHKLRHGHVTRHEHGNIDNVHIKNIGHRHRYITIKVLN
jgi:hypothetical protein